MVLIAIILYFYLSNSYFVNKEKTQLKSDWEEMTDCT